MKNEAKLKALKATEELAKKLRKAHTMTRHKSYGPDLAALLKELGIDTNVDPAPFMPEQKAETADSKEEKDVPNPQAEAAKKLSPDAIKQVLASLKQQ